MKIVCVNQNGKSAEFTFDDPTIMLVDADGLANYKYSIITTKGNDQDGEDYIGSTAEKRNVVISFSILQNHAKVRNALYDVFWPRAVGTLYYYDDFVSRKIDYRVESVNIPIIGAVRDCTLSLICTFPFLQDMAESSVKIAQWIGDFHFPLFIPEKGIVFEHRAPSLIVNVVNPGNVRCGVTIQFRALATVVNPSIFNVGTREYFTIKKTMSAGEILEVTTHYKNKKVKSIYNGETVNAMDFVDDPDVTFLQLSQGDNYFRCNADSGLDQLECTITYNALYLGV